MRTPEQGDRFAAGFREASPGDIRRLGIPYLGCSSAVYPCGDAGNETPGTVYVTGQGLYYDTFVVKDPLPFEGRFQKIENGTTEFGPRDAGYLGGRWWEDTNGDNIMDADDHYFLCPLLGPGRETP